MKYLYLFNLLFMAATSAIAQSNFKQNQLKFERVSNAFNEKGKDLQKELNKAGYTSSYALLLAAYKAEGKLEVWLKANGKNQFKLFKTYDFCAHSGKLGPKVIEGDLQTPEGFYKINVFNPMSNFHLSLGIDYPNAVDKVRTGKSRKTGGEIYIHGDCKTVGCIPITDDKIKEVYILAVEARNNGQKDIPVYIFPFRMTDANMAKYSNQYPEHVAFWKTLKSGYKVFTTYRDKIDYVISKGTYIPVPKPLTHHHDIEE